MRQVWRRVKRISPDLGGSSAGRADAVAKVGVLHDACRAFNQRRVEDLLAMLVADVEWPDLASDR
jgi:hypothetical protein